MAMIHDNPVCYLVAVLSKENHRANSNAFGWWTICWSDPQMQLAHSALASPSWAHAEGKCPQHGGADALAKEAA